MTPIRPLAREDVPAVAGLYADFVGWNRDETLPGLVEFFERVLLDHPFADPEIPTLVYEDPRDGVVGVIGSNARRFTFGDRPVRVACSGPLIVHPAHRPRGVGALLLRRYIAGSQDLTFNDRSIDQVHEMWQRLGGVTDTTASIGWARVLSPVSLLARGVSRRTLARPKPPGTRLLAMVDAPAGRRLHPRPSSGITEPLTNEALLDLLPRLRRRFPLQPSYTDEYLSWLFQEMEGIDLEGCGLRRRLVRAEDGRPVGWYVVYVAPHGMAHVIQVAAGDEDVGLVLDHLMHDAAEQGALEVRGRFEAHLLPYLRERWCRLVRIEWALLHSRDPELLGIALSGRALLSRLDGEWWMRPRASAR